MFSVKYLANQPVYSSPRLCVRGVGIRETMPPSYISRPQGTGDYLLMLFHDTVYVGEEENMEICAAGTIVLWGREHGHYYGNSQMRWSHSWIHCEGALIAEAFAAIPEILGRPIPLFNPSRAARYLLDIHEEITGPLTADPKIMGNTLENLIGEAVRSVNSPCASSIPKFLLQARQKIESRYDENLDLESLAHAAHLSKPYFCTAFRRAFGVTPINYLIQRRMEAAAVLLRDTSLDVGEVGRRVGYDDLFHFSKLFKRYVGIPPSRFRQTGGTDQLSTPNAL
jgi:AraC family transcriptional regulator of arabinose operon